jgi:beta-alanine--pyruvate transaminase
MIAGFDLAPGDRPGQRGLEVQKRLFEAGLHIKTTGDAGIIAPPLVADRSHIDEICGILRDVLKVYPPQAADMQAADVKRARGA